MPLLKQENPSITVGLSAAAQRIREDAQLLDELAAAVDPTDIAALRAAPAPLRRRAIEGFLRRNGFPEPSAEHIRQAEAVVFSDNPSARATFGGLTLRRSYDRLCADREQIVLETRMLPPEGFTPLPEIGMAVRTAVVTEPGEWTVCHKG